MPSSLIAQAFASVGFAVLPDIAVDAEPARRLPADTALLQLPCRYSWISPRDFDISPYFGVIKPVPSRRAVRLDDPRVTRPHSFEGDVAASAA